MDVLDLRNALETVLVDRLGTYTLSNGTTAPAISVRSIGEPMQPNTKVGGLEAILRWTLFLVDWDGTNAPHLAAQDVLLAFPGTTMQSLPVAQDDGPRSQLQLVIRTFPLQ
jgi:hypothetical protein